MQLVWEVTDKHFVLADITWSAMANTLQDNYCVDLHMLVSPILQRKEQLVVYFCRLLKCIISILVYTYQSIMLSNTLYLQRPTQADTSMVKYEGCSKNTRTDAAISTSVEQKSWIYST